MQVDYHDAEGTLGLPMAVGSCGAEGGNNLARHHKLFKPMLDQLKDLPAQYFTQRLLFVVS